MVSCVGRKYQWFTLGQKEWDLAFKLHNNIFASKALEISIDSCWIMHILYFVFPDNRNSVWVKY